MFGRSSRRTRGRRDIKLPLSVCTMLFILGVVLQAKGAEIPKSVFIHSRCDGKASAELVSSLREGIQASRAYQLVRTLDDDGRMGIVLTVYMDCVERNDVIAVATSYGLAKCYSEKNCHLSVDGRSIKSALCTTSGAAECGKTLFEAFDNYMKT